MRELCYHCHRPPIACFCAHLRPFASHPRFALVVHPYEARSTVGTAWIIRRSISNSLWFRSDGAQLHTDPNFLQALHDPQTVPLLLFPGPTALNMSQATDLSWSTLVPSPKLPLFFVIDGTWTQARAMLRKCPLLSALPRVSFDPGRLSEYGFKKQPHPSCLSSLEGVHQTLEVLASRSWARLPESREHNQMVQIFRRMVDFQETREKFPRIAAHLMAHKLAQPNGAPGS